MYINDIHILYYLGFGLLGLVIGQLISILDVRLASHKKTFTKKALKEVKKNFELKYIFMLVMSAIYICLLYFKGIDDSSLIKNLELIKLLVITPMIILVITIDYKHTIIPNRLNLTMFEAGIIFAIIYGFNNVSITLDMFAGMLVGGGIFLAITVIGGLIAGKEAMGFGDVKLMAALGLFFGVRDIIVITLLSFLIACVISILLMIIKKKGKSEYIPFGPFIAIATLIVIIVPIIPIINFLLMIFTLGKVRI